MKHILDILFEIVENIRDYANVTNIVDNSNNTYTISTNSTKNLKINDYVYFKNTDNFIKSSYLVTEVNSTNFKISEKKGISINKKGIWYSSKPYYFFEKWTGAANEVSLNHVTSTFSKQNYPLIFVLLDITEKREVVTDYREVDLKVFFINNTKQEVNAQYRLLNNFKTVLIPLYQKFIANIKTSYYVHLQNDLLPHDYVERYYAPNQLNDIVDAIECTLTLKIKNQYNCLT